MQLRERCVHRQGKIKEIEQRKVEEEFP